MYLKLHPFSIVFEKYRTAFDNFMNTFFKNEWRMIESVGAVTECSKVFDIVLFT